MLKSTHRSVLPPSLPPGWTEHKAPTGHTYYYNADTKQSTYSRPTPSPPIIGPPTHVSLNPSQSFLQYQSVEHPAPDSGPVSYSSVGKDNNDLPNHRGGKGVHHAPRFDRPQPTDKPKSRQPIPACEPWFLVYTKYGRRFVYNTEKEQSFWRIPEKLKDGILALDQQRIKEKVEALVKEEGDVPDTPNPEPRPIAAESVVAKTSDAGEDSEYEEVEVTDDEDTDVEGNTAKRQRTEELKDHQPIEFNEDDIAFQLASMDQDYGLLPGEYDDGNMEWESADGVAFTDEDAVALFKDLLDDSGSNPYSPWDKLVDEGTLVDDTRYTVLTTMKARKEVWEQWTREKIGVLKEQRAKEEKKDPRIPYLSFLHKHATPKLYWPEFKRKHKKAAELRDTAMADKEREKLYREHINRLRLPQSTLKSDLLTLLKAQPISVLNNATLASHLPPALLPDIRYISLDAHTRDAMIEAFISTLPPPTEDAGDLESEEAKKERHDRERRHKALEGREKYVAEEKRRQERDLKAGKGRLREEEAEIARAMQVSKRGLKNQLMGENE